MGVLQSTERDLEVGADGVDMGCKRNLAVDVEILAVGMRDAAVCRDLRVVGDIQDMCVSG